MGDSSKRSRVIFLTDIEDMQCHTTGKFRRYVGDETKLGEACIFEEGKPVGFRSAQQKTLLDLMSAGRCIAVTGRTTQRYKDVQLGFSDFAIAAFGGVILHPDGSVDKCWHDQMASKTAETATELHGLCRTAKGLAAGISDTMQVEVAVDDGLPLFISVTQPKVVQADYEAMGLELVRVMPAGWKIHLNDSKLVVYPPFLGKGLACKYFLDNLAGEHDLVIGMGDSLTDVEFMEYCTFMTAPVTSQIFSALRRSHHP